MKENEIKHPGETLYKRYMKPLRLSQNKVGRDLGVSPRRINEIVNGRRKITPDTALRLSLYFDQPPTYWLTLQMEYELELEKLKFKGSIPGT